MNGSTHALSDRTTARIVGVLFIIGTAAGALSWLVMAPIMDAPGYLAGIATHQGQMAAGALLVLTMGIALSLVPVVFYPVARRHSEVLATGYIVFRGALEGFVYIALTFGWLLLIALSTEPAATVAIADAVKTGVGVLSNQVTAIPFGIGALMFGALLYIGKLVPRWLAVWGLIGAVLYIAAPLARIFGFSLDYLMGPLALQEMVLGVWLIAKGFSPAAAATAKRSAALPKAATA